MELKIEIAGLNKFYGQKHALKDVNLTIEQGMFGLLGRNGAGKTTLMKTLATLLKKDSGDIRICGMPVEEAREIRRITGYLPQEFSMYGSMTVYESMDYLGVLSGLTKKQRQEAIPEILSRVNLTEQRKKKVRALSGGMKQRLGIAQAILHDPKVLIVDEPTAGLDPEERVRFRNLLCEIAQERIVILSTHIVGDIESTCESIAVLNEGEILFQGKMSELIELGRDRVFTMEIDKNRLPEIQSQHIVTGMLTLGNRVSVRFLSETQPYTNALPCEAGVEDAYIYLMGGN